MTSPTVASSLSSTVILNDGCKMPLFGLGTYQCTTTKDAVLSALRAGYRLIDNASMYKNEGEVGEAIRESGVSREEVFIVSKCWTDQHGREATLQTVQTTLSSLGVDYIDLYLIHSPIGGKLLETYDCLLELKDKGLIRSVGVSNFGTTHLEAIKTSGRPLPAVNQVELHPFYRSDAIVKWCRHNGVTIMGYTPLAKCSKLDHPQICQIAKKHGRSPVQVMLRWSVQYGYITIPKASSEHHIKANADVFNWCLDEADISTMKDFPQAKITWDPTIEPWEN